MSHFTVLVIGENPEKQLAPFDESKRVKGYIVDCDCVGWVAKRAGREAAEKEYKTIDQIRNEYHALPKEERTDEQWKEMLKPYEEIEKRVEQSHPLCGKPDPECKDCKGTGKRKSTYNPKSKWDWYQLGGRWNGYFLLKPTAKGVKGRPGVMAEPDTNPLHADQARKCDIDWEGMAVRDRAGAEKTWEEFQKEKAKSDSAGFIYGIKDGTTKEQFLASRSHPSTFAVLYKKKWFARGEMHWWAIVTDEKEEEKWEEEFDKLLKSLPEDTLLSVYDCHI